ncbi:MAG TPA: 2-oxoacid:acceptor oxidoreductase family protein [Spirochaetota bacterium]|nr:2-oxoacid:acceptor oxidoreductase family protein [Spirochaetota bacterium]HOM37570.1 2-oxoacid:acceptor oxidoreductase family protein [Spirochaetota bacterium]HPQ49459.1 2-oxoacid:acceptor oxidoreductase family protein [Spirochaetota bacterium]
MEIEIIGRGGQGVVVAGEILASALFYEGYFVKEFPFFGTERRGAPVRAYLRVSNNKILGAYQIYKPDYSIVFNYSQLSLVQKNIPVLVNSTHIIKEVDGDNVINIDANHIAIKNNLGTEANPIINTIMCGAFARIFGIRFHNLERAIRNILSDNLLKNNINAAREVYNTLKIKERELCIV